MESEDKLSAKEITSYDRKHRLIRGSMELKYPPRESRCRSTCGYWHYKVEVGSKTEERQHPCFLKIGHVGPCEFSTECVLMLTGRMAA